MKSGKPTGRVLRGSLRIHFSYSSADLRSLQSMGVRPDILGGYLASSRTCESGEAAIFECPICGTEEEAQEKWVREVSKERSFSPLQR